MQVVARAVNEELLEVVRRVGLARPLLEEGRLQVGRHAHHLVLGEEARDLAGHEDRVEELEEVLVLDLVVREEEGHGLAHVAGLVVDLLEVVLERVDAVGLGQRDLEEEVARDVGREARQALLARAADADEQRAAARHLDDAADADHVAQRVLEEHELELAARLLLVLLGHEHLDAAADVVERAAGLVDLGRLLDEHVVVVEDVLAEEVDVEGLLLGRGVQRAAEGALDHVLEAVREPELVRVRGELVLEDAAALVLPEPQQRQVVVRRRHLRAAGLDRVLGRQQHALEDARELAHVEGVVELGRRRKHLGLDAAPELDRGRRELGYDGHEVLAELLGVEAAAQHLAVEVVDGLDGRQHEVEGEELALEAVRDVVAAAARVRHGRDELQVLADLEVAALVLVEEVDAALVDELAHDLVRRLVAPRVHGRHADVVDEDGHLLVVRRAEALAAALVEVRLDRLLEHARLGGAREVDALEHALGRVEGGEEHERRARLGRARAAEQQHGLLVRVQLVEQEDGARRVHGRHEQVAEVELLLVRVDPDRRLPARPLERAVVDLELVDGLARVALGAALRADLAHVAVEARAVLRLEHAADGPAAAEDHEALELQREARHVGGRRRHDVGGLVEQRRQQHVEAGHGADAREPADVVAVARHEVEAVAHVDLRVVADELEEERAQHGLVLGRPRQHPRLHDGLPVQVRVRDVDDARAAHGGRARVGQRLVLEEDLDVVRHGEAVARGERQDLVVVEHGVEVLDPDGVDGPVLRDPRDVGQVAVVVLLPDGGEDALDPLAGDGVGLAVELRRLDGLGVHAHDADLLAVDAHERGLQRLEDARLAAAGRAREHDAVAHEARLVQLDDLVDPRVVQHELVLGHADLDGGHDGRVLLLGRVRALGEEVREHGEEERHVLRDELGEVHVAQRAVHEDLLVLGQVLALGAAAGAQHGEDVAQAEVVVLLLRELLLAELVADEELARQQRVVRVADGAELHLLDELAVGHHHGHAAEERLEVLGQLLAAGVARVHGDEGAAHRVEQHVLRVARELEVLDVGLLGVRDGQHLLRHDREHGQRDAVELVEAAPEAALAQALEDLGAVRVAHLVRAVGHDDEDAERAAHVLGRLRLARAGGPGRRAAEVHVERLRERDVAAVRERRHDEALLAAEVLELVVEDHVRDLDVADAVLVEEVLALGHPVEARLLEPLEVVEARDLLVAVELVDVVDHVARVHVDRHHGLDLGAVHLGAEVREAPARQRAQHHVRLLVRDLERVLVLLAHGERRVDVRRPHHLDAEQRVLRADGVVELLEREHVRAHDAELDGRLLEPHLHGALHLDEHVHEPVLDVAGHLDGLAEHDDLLGAALAAHHALDDELVLLVVDHVADGVEDLLVVLLHLQRVRALREDLQQHRVRDEVEARELVALLLEVALERLLALLELVEHAGQAHGQHLVGAGVDDDLLLARALHDGREVLVDLLELLGHDGHLLGDVAAKEDGLERAPEQLHLEPELERLADVAELLELVARNLAEEGHVAHGQHGLQLHLRVLERLDDAADAHEHVHAARLPGLEGEGLDGPLGLDLLELVLDAQLLVGAVRDLRDLLHLLDERRVQQLLQLELGVHHVELVAREPLDALPVARHDADLGELLQQRQHELEVLDALLERVVRLPVAQLLGHLAAARAEALRLGAHGADVGGAVRPEDDAPLLHAAHHVAVERVELAQQLQLLLGLVELRVLGQRQREERLAVAEELALAVADVVLVLEAAQALLRLAGRDALDHGPVLDVVRAEGAHVRLEVLDVLEQLLAEARLQRGNVLGRLLGLVAQLHPVRAQHGARVHLVLVHVALGQVHLEQQVHLHDGVDLQVDGGLAVADLVQHVHEVLDRVDRVRLAVELVERRLEVLGQVHEVRRGRLVQVVAVLHLPLRVELAQLALDGRGVERERANVVHEVHARDLVVDLRELGQLALVVVDDRVLLHELLVDGVRVALPHPLEALEGLEEGLHLHLRAAHGARQQQHDAHDLEVVRDLGEEGRAVVLGQVALAPVEEVLARAQHGRGALVDGALHLLERRAQPHARRDELHLELEEGPLRVEEDARGARGDALLERVERVLGAALQRRVHEVVVVLDQLLALVGRDRLDVRVERVARDHGDEVADGALHLHVLALQQRGLLLHVVLLRADELLEREALVGRQRDEQRLAHDAQVLLDAVLDHVVHVAHELLEAVQALVHVLLVGVDVHARPGQRDHARPQAVLHVVQRGPHERGRDRDDLGRDARVLAQREAEVVEVALELVLLQQHDARALRDGHAHAVEALGLADELQDLGVEVHVEAAVLRVPDDERRLQARLGRLDGLDPRVVPEVLVRHERARDAVVHLDDALAVLGREDGRVGLEAAHGRLNALQQVAAPRDVAGHGRQVARLGRVLLVLLVHGLHELELVAEGGEDDGHLVVEVRAQALALQHVLELLQQVERAVDAADALEGAVDELLQLDLERVDVHVELDEVAVEVVAREGEQVVALGLEADGEVLELLRQRLHALELVAGQRAELHDGRVEVDELDDAAAEEVEAAEDGLLVEVRELLALRVGRELLLGQAVRLLVHLVQLEAALEPLDELRGLLLPEALANVVAVEAQDGLLAVQDERVRDLDEEVRHALGRVVVARDGVDHLDRVHERGQRVDDGRGRAAVERLDELLERREVLDVVLGLVRGLGDVHVEVLPAAQQREERGRHLVRRALGHGRQHGHDRLDVLALELLRHARELLHARAPVVEHAERPGLVLGVARALDVGQVLVDLLGPLLEQALELRNHGVLEGGLLVLAARRRALERLVQVDAALLAVQLEAAAEGAHGLGQRGAHAHNVVLELVAQLVGRLAPVRPLGHVLAVDVLQRHLEQLQRLLGHLAVEQLRVVALQERAAGGAGVGGDSAAR